MSVTASVTITMQLDEAAVAALAAVIRAAAPEDYGAEPKAWYRAIDQLSPLGRRARPRPRSANSKRQR